MARLPKAEKEALVARVSHPYGAAELMCDGFKVSLQVTRVKEMTYRVMVYVNGVWKGEWCGGNKDFPEQKFARRIERFIHSQKDRERMMKTATVFGRKGSKERTDWEAKANAKWVGFDPTFASGLAAVNHLLKVCESVSVPEEPQP